MPLSPTPACALSYPGGLLPYPGGLLPTPACPSLYPYVLTHQERPMSTDLVALSSYPDEIRQRLLSLGRRGAWRACRRAPSSEPAPP